MKKIEVVLVVMNSEDSSITKLVPLLATTEMGSLQQFEDGIEIETLSDSVWSEVQALCAMGNQSPADSDRELEREDTAGENGRYLGLPGLSFETIMAAVSKASELNLNIVSEYRGYFK
ncbi:hypothetical protein [Comamonas thiooxydans]|uniref:hypothetical protein n=1 Tax=Comamonas thiooxydans TaxID=363952 RepID=UPI000B40E8B0|nr:hypothetical protein [Comamonas thiooxydans]